LEKIQIWTSDNKVGMIEGGKHFYQALHAAVAEQEIRFDAETRVAIQVLRDEGFLPMKLPRRRLEWEQFD
jgi:hypothetical protein